MQHFSFLHMCALKIFEWFKISPGQLSRDENIKCNFLFEVSSFRWQLLVLCSHPEGLRIRGKSALCWLWKRWNFACFSGSVNQHQLPGTSFLIMRCSFEGKVIIALFQMQIFASLFHIVDMLELMFFESSRRVNATYCTL